jgi:hypothetical protein
MSMEQQYCCEDMRRDLEQVCDQHPDRFDCPDNLIARVRGGYGLIVHKGADIVAEIRFCPWCGIELPPIQSITEEI